MAKRSPRKIEFEIYEVPPAISSFYGRSGHRSFISKKGKEFREHLQWSLKEMIYSGGIAPYRDERLRVDLEFHFKGKRKRDTDNYIKSTLDSFSNILYNDDEQIDMITAKRFYHADGYKTVVTIKEL